MKESPGQAAKKNLLFIVTDHKQGIGCFKFTEFYIAFKLQAEPQIHISLMDLSGRTAIFIPVNLLLIENLTFTITFHFTSSVEAIKSSYIIDTVSITNTTAAKPDPGGN